MNTFYLLTGTNLGNREQNLERARELISKTCGVVDKTSAVYETAAWGKTDQPSFLNQALRLQTSLDPLPLLRKVLKIEQSLGRSRNEKYGPRIIDIDILFFNNEAYKKPALTIPHPQLQNRRFVLVPLTEIAPGLVHPVLHTTVAELLDTCPDPLPVTRHNGS